MHDSVKLSRRLKALSRSLTRSLTLSFTRSICRSRSRSRSFSRSLTRSISLTRSLSVSLTLPLLAGSVWAADCPAFLNHDFQKLHSSETVNICKAYAGKPLLIVNTASHCGYTPQFKGLEAINEKYKQRGLILVGFPSDDFNQEAKDEAETAQVCYENYGVTFTMLAPLPVKGAAANPVFKELNRQSHEPTWNFNKYLVKPDGSVAEYFDSEVTPESPELTRAIERLLKRG